MRQIISNDIFVVLQVINGTIRASTNSDKHILKLAKLKINAKINFSFKGTSSVSEKNRKFKLQVKTGRKNRNNFAVKQK